MAGMATSPQGSETSRKKSKLFKKAQNKPKSSHRSTVSRISGLFYRQVLPLGGGDTPTSGVIRKVECCGCVCVCVFVVCQMK